MGEIVLTGKTRRVALVDDEDVAFLSQWRWHHIPAKNSDGYAARTDHGRTIYMHREIMKPPAGLEVDHRRPGSGLDNRRENLRLVDHATNLRNRRIQRNNTSGYRGVTWDKRRCRWHAHIKVRGRHHNLGNYATPEQAFGAYEQARLQMGLLRATQD